MQIFRDLAKIRNWTFKFHIRKPCKQPNKGHIYRTKSNHPLFCRKGIIDTELLCQKN